ncbi:MAG: hypothetical protein IIZ39_13875, partial [Blautia sp.]|nr:hypothetical protein [Blautia sp.]
MQDLPELGILERIRRHDEAKPMTLTERFSSIVMGQDDYGEAMLITSYYEQMGEQVPEIIRCHSLKEEAAGYPLASIRERCKEFKEDIKLAQSNGLFDVAGVERMESILQNMEIWYERAEETMN